MYRSAMEWLNYHHLHYFWVVAREGSIARACDVLKLAQPTISGQIRALEEALGERLFVRSGRGLTLTDTGRVVFRYADEIFSLGRELMDTLRGRPIGRPLRFAVGVADVLSKLVAYKLLEPALRLGAPLRIICREDRPERLLAELAVHDLDLVLCDGPVPPGMKGRVFNHLLGECGVTLFGRRDLAERFRPGFPASLDGAPILLPTEGTTLRRSLEQWLDGQGIRPRVVGEFDDSALLKVFGEAGLGVFPMPAVVEEEVVRSPELQVVGRIEAVRERFYAWSMERRLKHPAVVAISEAAREELFDAPGGIRRRDASPAGPPR